MRLFHLQFQYLQYFVFIGIPNYGIGDFVFMYYILIYMKPNDFNEKTIIYDSIFYVLNFYFMTYV